MEKQICARCVMDSTVDSKIRFDESGNCNYCTEALARRPNEYFPDDAGKRALEDAFAAIKRDGADKDFDCIVGVSGGLDSSYVMYLGHQYSLRMLAIHIDDGYDTQITKENIHNLCERAGVSLVSVRPDVEEFKDLMRSFFLARVPNLAMPQDNVLFKALSDTAKERGIRYSLSGGNFSLECILQRGEGINAADKKHILAIHSRFGRGPLDKLRFLSLFEKYIGAKYFSPLKTLRPLNWIDYRFEKALEDLSSFSGYAYYGGKHYESVLTRFLQCWYLPKKYGIDKRKSHFSSMIVTGQMTRAEALGQLEQRPYISEALKESDMDFIAYSLDMSRDEFDALMLEDPMRHSDYPSSYLNRLSAFARRFRRFLGE